MSNYKIKIIFTEPLLGTAPLNTAIYSDYIATKAPRDQNTDDEIETIIDIEKQTTGFHRLDNEPILYDYVVKGFAKDACGMLRRVRGTKSGQLTAYKKAIDGLLFVQPRQIPIHAVGPIEIMERPLRAQTAQGERVALARSEMVPAGSSITFTLLVLGVIDEPLLREWFDYGALRGLGQWRNASWGRFTYEMVPE